MWIRFEKGFTQPSEDNWAATWLRSSGSDWENRHSNHIIPSYFHLPISCRSLVDRCGSLGSFKPHLILDLWLIIDIYVKSQDSVKYWYLIWHICLLKLFFCIKTFLLLNIHTFANFYFLHYTIFNRLLKYCRSGWSLVKCSPRDPKLVG